MAGRELVRRTVAVLAAVLVLAAGTSAAAQSNSGSDEMTAEEKAEFKSLVGDAKEAYESGRFEEAAETLKKAYEISPEPLVLYRTALSYERLGDKEKAIEYYERFVEEAPESKKRAGAKRSIERLQQEIEEERSAETTDDSSAESGSNTGPIILTVAGSALAVTGGVFGGLAANSASKHNDKVGSYTRHRQGDDTNSDDPTREKVQSDLDPLASKTRTFRTLAFVAGGVGLVSGTTGLILWMSGNSSASGDGAARRAIDWSIGVGPGSLRLEGRF